MTLPLPPAGEVCAVIVGIERYAPLGDTFAAPGTMAGALSFAHWLVHERGVPAAQVQLWLAAPDGVDLAARVLAAGLAGAQLCPYTTDAFWQAMLKPAPAWQHGRFLMVYFCGHGVVAGAQQQQYLVLPESVTAQLRCLDTLNWRAQLRGGGWQQFGHQLWIVDACRNRWGAAMKLSAVPWEPDTPHPVRQCVMFSCATGESANIDTQQGPRFTRELLLRLRAAGPGDWPAFDVALREAAAVLRADPDMAQSPALSMGEDWYGAALLGAAGPTLREVFDGVPLPYEALRPYVQRALPAGCLHAVPEGLDGAFDLLANLQEDAAGVPPLWDFAERVARVQPLPALRAWLDIHLSPQQRAELDNRLADAACRARLLLWYRDDVALHCMEGELQVSDVGAGVRPWPRQPALPVTRDTVPAVVGQWLQAVFDHVGNITPELMIELYLPRPLLTAEAYDTATVPLTGDVWRLGEDDPALLRCTDRYKARSKRDRLLRHGPGILARLQAPGAAALRWARPGETAQDLKASFIGEHAAPPVWLAFDCAAGGDDEPLKNALDEGLPAVLWLRAPVDAAGRAALQAALGELLGAPLDTLPQRLRKFRAQPPSPAARHVSLLLDDPARLPALLTTWTQPQKLNTP